MAIAWLIEPIGAGRIQGENSQVLDYTPEAASQTFTEGAPFTFVSGKAAECGADPSVIHGFARLAGRNLAAADSLPKLPYIPVSGKERRYRGTLKEALNTATAIDTAVGLAKDGTTGIWQFSTATTNKPFKIRKIDSRAANGDTNTIVECLLA
jgi:hypothetical protein